MSPELVGLHMKKCVRVIYNLQETASWEIPEGHGLVVEMIYRILELGRIKAISLTKHKINPPKDQDNSQVT